MKILSVCDIMRKSESEVKQMKSMILTYLELLQYPVDDEITTSKIKQRYLALAEQEKTAHERANVSERLAQLEQAQEYLTKDIKYVRQFMVCFHLRRANELFWEKRYDEALAAFRKVEPYKPRRSDATVLMTADECIRYGLCCILSGFYIRRCDSYVFVYGNGGDWVSDDSVVPDSGAEWPEHWEIVKQNISALLARHPYIATGYRRGCSGTMRELFEATRRNILEAAWREFNLQENRLRKLRENPKGLAHYIGEDKGFFVHEEQLYYIYHDGTKETQPIYRVEFVDDRIVMEFFKFSGFRKKKGNKQKKKRIFDIRLITDNFLYLECKRGDVLSGLCEIKRSAYPIPYERYMQKPQKGRCPLCGGRRILGICLNFCWRQLQK